MAKEMYDAVVKLIATIVVCIPLMFLGAWFIELLWNWLVPGLLGLPELTYWQAFGLRVLCSLLFKSHANVDTK